MPALLCLTLLAPALGGSTRLWAQAIIVLGTGLLVIVSPPRRSLGLSFNLAFFGLALTAFSGFLPAQWFEVPWWRKILTENYEITLPQSLSPQPWVTLEAILLLIGGLLWVYYLFTRGWTAATRRRALECFSAGVIALTAVSWIVQWADWSIWFWPQKDEFGFFPNRNHTADLLALGGVISCALAGQEFRKSRKRGLFWAAGVIPIVLALLHIGSRAGFLLFFGGLALWLVWSWALAPSMRKAAVYGAIFLLALTPLFLCGERTLQRLGRQNLQPLFTGEDSRLRLQADAMAVAASLPLAGVGLGNFDRVFALSRNKSAEENRATHPESDWVWLVTETGWIGGGLLSVLVFQVLAKAFPRAARSQSSLRLAAMVCGLMFVAHGLVDVPGHRMGTIWPATLLLSIAYHPGDKPRRATKAPVLARFAAVPMALVAGLWIISSTTIGRLPTSGTLALLESQIGRAIGSGDAEQVIAASTAALEIAPLDWRSYYRRATAEARAAEQRAAAVLDFQRARFLEPNSSAVPMKEGELWLNIEPSLVLPAWSEALRRAPGHGSALYRRMLALGGLELRERLRELAEDNIDRQLVYLTTAGPSEFPTELGKLLRLDPELKSLLPDDRARLFATWWRNGNRSELVLSLNQHADWQKAGWRWLAEHAADQANYKIAFAIARQSVAVPVFPMGVQPRPLAEVLRQFARRPTDLATGYELHLAQIREGKLSEALATIRRLAAIPNHPRYVRFIEADLCAAEGRWKQAWEAIKRYGLTS